MNNYYLRIERTNGTVNEYYIPLDMTFGDINHMAEAYTSLGAKASIVTKVEEA